MYIIQHKGFFFRSPINGAQLSEAGIKKHATPLVDFVYGYEERNGQKVPTTTVCIIPFLDGEQSELWFAIGMAYCCDKDQAEKAKGRHIAATRASAAIDMDRDMRWKPTHQHPFEGRVCGIRTHTLDAQASVDDMGFADDVVARIRKSFEYLTGATANEAVA